MADPIRPLRSSELTANLSLAAIARRLTWRSIRPALGIVTRSAVLVAVVVALGGVSQIPSPIALANHTTADMTPVPAPGYQFGATPTPWGSGMLTATPTLQTTIDGSFINPPTGGASGLPSSGGASVQSGSVVPGQQYPTGTGQQSVPGQQYPTTTAPGAAPPGGLPGSINLTGSPAPTGSDPCYGDELISFAPESPRVGNEFLIAVTSSHPHPYGRLAGTEKTNFVRERSGQRGFVWEWTVQPTYPGQHEYTFYVDSTVPCQKIQLRVLDSLATRTPTPTKRATPYGWDNGNSNENNNANSNANDNFSFTNPGPNYGSAPVVDPSVYVVPGQDLHQCSEFLSQSNAQRVLRYAPSDPNRLDSEDGSSPDGVACSTYNYASYPYDRDTTPVTLSSATPVTPTRTPTAAPFDPKSYLGQGDHYGCRDFVSHAQAQAVLRADPSDPNRLDANPRDGLACGGQEAAEDGVAGGLMPAPFDGTRVPRP
jgi:hypothetical protein